MIWQYQNFAVESSDPVEAVKEAYRLLIDEWTQSHSPDEISGYMTSPGTGNQPVAVEAVLYAGREISRVMGLPLREPGIPAEVRDTSNMPLLLLLGLGVLAWLWPKKKR